MWTASSTSPWPLLPQKKTLLNKSTQRLQQLSPQQIHCRNCMHDVHEDVESCFYHCILRVSETARLGRFLGQACPPPLKTAQRATRKGVALYFLRILALKMTNACLGPGHGARGSHVEPVFTRKPQRITITVSWSVYKALLNASDQQGRSLSNLAAFWLERQADHPGPMP